MCVYFCIGVCVHVTICGMCVNLHVGDTDNIEVEGSAEEKLDLNASYPLPRPMESPHRFRKKISAPSDPSITGFTGTGSIPIAVSKKIVSVL